MNELHNTQVLAEQCRFLTSRIITVSRLARRYRFLLAVIAALIVLPVQAGQLSLLLNGKAVHLEESAGVDFNEENWGAGLQYDFTAENRKWVPFLTTSGFKDSNGNPSYYAGGGTMRRFHFGDPEGSLHVGVGAVAFLMIRKDYEGGDPFPGVLPVATIGNDRFALNVTYIPKVDPKMVPIIFFQLRTGLH